MTKIYTKTGDEGRTALAGGTRVDKDDERVEAYGTVDELGAQMGVVATLLDRLQAVDADSSLFLGRQVRQIQQQLFAVQGMLASETEAARKAAAPLLPEETDQLEHWLDAMDSQLPQLHAFVLAGGTLLAAECHVARTVCRRAERRVVSLSRHAEVDGEVLRYLNRLSDYLFTLARMAVHIEGKNEVFWQKS